jgi:DNA invertase Pin-like site-specific DNA recombinase
MTAPKPAPTPGLEVGNIRVSTADRGRKYSPAAQRDAIEAAAHREGVLIAEWLVDHESGITENRRDFRRLTQRVFQGGIATVWVLCVDRFARNTEDALRISRQFLEHGTKLKFVETPADLETPEGKFQFTQYAAFAAFEHARLRARTMAGRNKKMDSGKGRPDSWNLGYGFTVEGDTPRIVEKEAEVVRQIFRWRREGKSIYAIAGLLQSRGVKPRKAAFWSPATIRGMLMNRCYVGEYQRSRHTWAVPAIVSHELFDDVQRQMCAVYKRLVGRASSKFLLRGVVFCRCSRRMHGTECHTGSGGKWRHYRCDGKHHRNPSLPAPCTAPRISARVIEELVWRHIWLLLCDPARVRRLAEAMVAEEKRAHGASMKRDPARELEAACAELKRIQRMVQKGTYDEDEGAAEATKLRREIAILEAEIRALGKVLEIAPLDAVERACRAIAARPEPEGYEDRRDVLEGLLDLRARVDGEQVEITGKIPVPAAEPAAQKNCKERLDAVGDELSFGHIWGISFGRTVTGEGRIRGRVEAPSIRKGRRKKRRKRLLGFL